MIVVDIETSGTDPYKHSILSIGAVDFSSPNRLFYQECRIEDGKQIDAEALGVNGFKETDLRNPEKKALKSVLDEFIVWMKPIKDKTIAGHNVNFDAEFLNIAFRTYGISFSFGHRVVDTHSLVYSSMLSRSVYIPLKSDRTAVTSDYVFNYVGLPPEPKPHNALTGAKMEAEALSRLIYKRGLFNEYSQHSMPEYLR